MVPSHHSQWAGLVVCLLGEDSFTVDTVLCFRFRPSARIYGNVADARADIFWATRLGPLSKWVDDYLFFHIRQEFLQEHNERCKKWANQIVPNGGAIIECSRKWYRGETMPDDSPEEFNEDCLFLISDFSSLLPQSAEDTQFTCCMADINHHSQPFIIIWEISKDKPFRTNPNFTGLLWDIPNFSISLSPEKMAKYLEAINMWQAHHTHAARDPKAVREVVTHSTHHSCRMRLPY